MTSSGSRPPQMSRGSGACESSNFIRCSGWTLPVQRCDTMKSKNHEEKRTRPIVATPNSIAPRTSVFVLLQVYGLHLAKTVIMLGPSGIGLQQHLHLSGLWRIDFCSVMACQVNPSSSTHGLAKSANVLPKICTELGPQTVMGQLQRYAKRHVCLHAQSPWCEC